MSSYEAHKEIYKNYTIKIIQDEDAANPFKEFDGEPDIIGWHRRYNFNTDKNHARFSPEEFRTLAKREKFICLPLYMYDHSGLSFSTKPFSCQWDSGQLGFIYWTPEKVDAGQGKGYSKRYTKKRRELLIKQLENSISLLNDYHQGNVWGYAIEDSEGNELDSCWGFYGDYDSNEYGVLKEAKIIVDCYERKNLPLLAHAGLIA